MAIKVKYIDLQMYIDFCIENGGVFNSYEWLKNYTSGLIFCGVYEKETQLTAVFYYSKRRIAGFNYLHCPSFTPNNGFYANLSSNNYASQKGEIKRVYTAIADFFDSFVSSSIIKIAFPLDCIDMQPFVWKKYKVIPNYTYQIDLHQSVDVILGKMTTERRNDIKKAKKDGVVIEKVSDYAIVKKLVLNTYSRTNVKKNDVMLDKILFEFANSNNSFSFVAFLNGNPISAVFCIFDKQKAYYLLGGYDNQKKHSGAGALALWSAIQHSQNMGLKVFDFEGSMIKPIEKFFRGFGGDLKPYFVINKANFLIEVGLKFFKRELY